MAEITTYNGMDAMLARNGTPDKKSVTSSHGLRLPAPFNRKSDTLEADLQKDCMEWLKTQKFYSSRVPLGMVLQRGKDGEAIAVANPMTGMSDLIALKEGKFYAIELKRTGGIISNKQLSVLKELQENGAYVYICTSFESFKKIFNNKVFELSSTIDGIKIV